MTVLHAKGAPRQGAQRSRVLTHAPGQNFRSYYAWIFAAAIFSALVAYQHWLKPVDNRIYDTIQSTFSPPPSDLFVTVHVDDESMANGIRPSSRLMHARLLENIALGKPKAVIYAFGIEATDEAAEGIHQRVREAVQRISAICGPRPVGWNTRSSAASTELFIVELTKSWACTGTLEPAEEIDGVQRGVRLVSPDAPRGTKHLSQAVSDYLRSLPDSQETYAIASSPPNLGYHRLWQARGYANYSVVEVSSGKVNPSVFRNRVIVVGMSSSNGLGSINAPSGPGGKLATTAELLAANIDAQLQGRQVQLAPQWINALIAGLLAVAAMAAFSLLTYGSGLLLTLLLSIGLLGASAWLPAHGGCWWSPAGAVFALLTSFLMSAWARRRIADQFLETELRQLSGTHYSLASRSPIDRGPAMMAEIRVLRHQLTQAQRLQDEARAQREEILSFLSHDIKSPFLAVLTYLASTHNSSTPHREQEVLLKLRASAQYGLDLTNGFQALIRARNMDRSLFKPVDVLTLIDEVVDEVWERAQSRQVEILCFPDFEPGIFVMGDSSQLRRLFVNLIENALQYGAPEEPVSISWWKSSTTLKISVKSKGLPILDEQAADIFEKHQRGPQARERRPEGSGLGLAICKSVVEVHGGSIALKRPEFGITTIEVQFQVMVDASTAKTPAR